MWEQGESPHWASLQRGDCQLPAATEAARTLGIEASQQGVPVKAHGKSMRVNSGTTQPDAGRAINKPFNFVFAQSRGCPGCPLQRLRRGTAVSEGRCLQPQTTGNPPPFPCLCPSGRTTRGRGILISEAEKRSGCPAVRSRSPRPHLSARSPEAKRSPAAPRGPPCRAPPAGPRRGRGDPGSGGATSGRRGRFWLRLRRGFPPPRARLPGTLSAARRGRGARCVTRLWAPLCRASLGAVRRRGEARRGGSGRRGRR